MRGNERVEFEVQASEHLGQPIGGGGVVLMTVWVGGGSLFTSNTALLILPCSGSLSLSELARDPELETLLTATSDAYTAEAATQTPEIT